ncbi:DExH-box ATP-dependent RNA helicase DExH1-like [Bidens hawaiensis]|uniref:DExH-box ATP-dependent RNA helicase DExH1-like n=1 Tax=Bidens hawaiensis TaxID=980011 RepID=UPI0040493E62
MGTRQVEAFDKNHWWGKMEEMKRGGDTELIIKHFFSRNDQQNVSDMGISARAFIIHMPSETERRVENLLDSSSGTQKVGKFSGTSAQSAIQLSQESDKTAGVSVLETDSAKKALSVELKERQDKQKESDAVKGHVFVQRETSCKQNEIRVFKSCCCEPGISGFWRNRVWQNYTASSVHIRGTDIIFTWVPLQYYMYPTPPYICNICCCSYI